MPGLPSGLEWIVILIIALLLFGVGRLGKIGGELGRGIAEFRKGLRGDEAEKENKEKPQPPAQG